jgi:hypothetical protein
MPWMEVRDAIAAGKTTVIVGTGGLEENGPHVATGKHNYVLRVVALVDPTLIRAEQRMKAGDFSVYGVNMAPLPKTLAPTSTPAQRPRSETLARPGSRGAPCGVRARRRPRSRLDDGARARCRRAPADRVPYDVRRQTEIAVASIRRASVLPAL